MSSSVIIKDEDGKCEREVCVDSEEELKSMTVEEFKRRVCPEVKIFIGGRYRLFYAHKILGDDCGIKHESPVHGFECRRCGVHSYILHSDEILKDGRTLGDYGIRAGCTILEIKDYISGSAGLPPSEEDVESLPEDQDTGIPKSQSMEQLLIDMEQPELSK